MSKSELWYVQPNEGEMFGVKVTEVSRGRWVARDHDGHEAQSSSAYSAVTELAVARGLKHREFDCDCVADPIAAHERLRTAADDLWDQYRDQVDAMPAPLRDLWHELTGAICEGPRSEYQLTLFELRQRMLRTPTDLSWAERRRRATEAIEVPALARLFVEAEQLRHDVRDVLEARLLPGGAHAIRGRTINVRLGLPWVIRADVPELHYCAGALPGDESDWYSDALDLTVPPAERVQERYDGVTVVFTEDMGLSLVSTSKRYTPMGG